MAEEKGKEKKAKAVAKTEAQAETQVEAQAEAQVEAEKSEPRKPSDELKVVIALKGDRAIVGIQSPDCDPKFTTIEGGLTAALAQVPSLVVSANAQWDANPLNPKAKMPEPPPAPPTPARTQSTRRAAPAAETAQPSMF